MIDKVNDPGGDLDLLGTRQLVLSREDFAASVAGPAAEDTGPLAISGGKGKSPNGSKRKRHYIILTKDQ